MSWKSPQMEGHWLDTLPLGDRFDYGSWDEGSLLRAITPAEFEDYERTGRLIRRTEPASHEADHFDYDSAKERMDSIDSYWRGETR